MKELRASYNEILKKMEVAQSRSHEMTPIELATLQQQESDILEGLAELDEVYEQLSADKKHKWDKAKAHDEIACNTQAY